MSRNTYNVVESTRLISSPGGDNMRRKSYNLVESILGYDPVNISEDHSVDVQELVSLQKEIESIQKKLKKISKRSENYIDSRFKFMTIDTELNNIYVHLSKAEQNLSESLLCYGSLKENSNHTKDIKFSVVESEVVSRDNRADLILRIGIDLKQVELDAKRSSKDDTDEHGHPIKYEDAYAAYLKVYEKALKTANHSGINVRRDGSIDLPKRSDLTFEIYQGSKKIRDLSDAEFKYDGSEVHQVHDSTYKIQF